MIRSDWKPGFWWNDKGRLDRNRLSNPITLLKNHEEIRSAFATGSNGVLVLHKIGYPEMPIKPRPITRSDVKEILEWLARFQCDNRQVAREAIVMRMMDFDPKLATEWGNNYRNIGLGDPEMGKRECVYFIQGDELGPVKIGYTASIAKRLERLQVGYPVELRVLATIPGDRTTEAEMHERFRDHRMHGDWFRWNWDLARLIEELSPTDRPSPAV